MELTREEWASTHQHFESSWWGTCANTYGEETKQIAYARVMGLETPAWEAGNAWPVWDVNGASIVDIGGGPVSMLLKCTHLAYGAIVDPCNYPTWTRSRYRAQNISVFHEPAEDWLPKRLGTDAGPVFDEAWCYNVLQHVHDPKLIIEYMRKIAHRIRIFEWVETEAYLGHPHVLHPAELQDWCGGGEGVLVRLDEQYKEIPVDSEPAPWRVEQLAWGGVFGG